MTFQKGNQLSKLRKNKQPMLGKKHSPETIEKMRVAKLGHKYNLGHRHSEETKEKCRQAKLGDKHPLWKGNNVTYHALHQWLTKNMPKPDLCQICTKSFAKHIANISGVYTKDFDDYLYLCVTCHHIIDGTVHNLHKNQDSKECPYIPNTSNGNTG